MTRWVRCGNSQKHKKVPGDATKWGEFDNQHAREIPLKKKKNIQSQADINKKVKALPSTTLYNKAEESLDEDFFEQDKYCLTKNSNEINEQENSTFDESHSNMLLSKNKEDFSTNGMHDSKIKKKKKRNNFDIEYSSLGGNSDGIDSNEVAIRHKKIKLENDCSIVTENNKVLEQANNYSDLAENSRIPEESFSQKQDKKKRKKDKKEIKLENDCSIVTENNKVLEQANNQSDFTENSRIPEESFSQKQDKKKRKKDKKEIKLENDCSIVTENNKVLEQVNNHSDLAENNRIPEESFSQKQDKKKRKKDKKEIKLENDCSIVTENNKVLEQANNHSDFAGNSRIPEESVFQKQDKKKRKKDKKEKRYNQADSGCFSTNDGTMETSFENSNEKQEDECIISPDKAIEPVQSLQDIDRSAKKKKVKKYSKMTSDSNESSVNNESCKNSSSKVENMKEIRLKKLKQKREELGLIQLPHNVENKLRKIKKRLMEKGFPPEKLKEILRQERRREELQYRKVYNPRKLCFGCREPGHVLADCPKKSESETGICFKCGSAEHTSYKCPEKIQGFPYAKCFICKEQGHISRNCPQNKRGVYPKGGRCNLCGNVNHLRKDCPTLKKKENEEEEITLPTLNEDVSIDAEVVKKEEIKRKSHKKSKVVKF